MGFLFMGITVTFVCEGSRAIPEIESVKMEISLIQAYVLALVIILISIILPAGVRFET